MAQTLEFTQLGPIDDTPTFTQLGPIDAAAPLAGDIDLPRPAGQLTPGNIDLRTRIRVQNPDKSISTVRTLGVTIDGKEVLIPTVIGGQVVSDEDAVQHYRRTGEHLGIFDTEAHATAFAQQLHESQAAMAPAPPMQAHGVTAPASVRVTTPTPRIGPAQPLPGAHIGPDPRAQAPPLDGTPPAPTAPTPPRSLTRQAVDGALALGGLPGRLTAEAIATTATGLVRASKAFVKLAPYGAIAAGIDVRPWIPKDSTVTIPDVNEFLEGVMQASTPAIIAGAGLAPVETVYGLIKAAIAAKVGGKAAEELGGSPDVQQLAENIAGLAVGFISGQGVLDKIAEDGAAILGKVKKTGGALTLAAKLSGSGFGTGDIPGARVGVPIENADMARPSERAPSARALATEESIRQEGQARADEAQATRDARAGTKPLDDLVRELAAAKDAQHAGTQKAILAELARRGVDADEAEARAATVQAPAKVDNAPANVDKPAVGVTVGARPDRYAPVEFQQVGPIEPTKPEPTEVAPADTKTAATEAVSTEKSVPDAVTPRADAPPEEPHTFSSTQVQLPPATAAKLTALAETIPDADLAEQGREDDPHVTVKYGIHTSDVEELRTLLAKEPPVTVTLGKTSVFPDSGHGDVVKVDVDSPALHALNAKIAAALETTDTHPDYKPHATVAYVKPGLGAQYAGKADLDGETTTIDHVTFTTKEGERFVLPLGGKTAEKKPVTPQLPPPGGGTGYVLPSFASTPGQRQPAKPAPTGTPNEVYRKFGTALTKAINAKDWPAVIAEADRFNKYYDDNNLPLPDNWARWERAKDDAELQMRRAAEQGQIPGTKPLVDAGKKHLPSDAEAPTTEEADEAKPDDRLPGGGSPGSGERPGPVGGAGAGRPEGVDGGESGTAPAESAAVDATPAAPGRTGGRVRSPRAGDSTRGAGPAAGTSAGVDAASHVDAAEPGEAPVVRAAAARGERPRHFVITDDDTLTAGGAVAKLKDNLAAIALLKELERDGRPASAEEQLVLARYVGWGNSALANVVDLRGLEYIKDPKHQEARQQLEVLLSPSELRSLADSVLNAHYSFAALPRALWAAVQRLGFKGGAILEPAVGAGHFLGTMPGPIVAHPRTRIMGVDLEAIASGIARQLYQDANIQTTPLEDARLPKGYFDLVISNVPFADLEVFDQDFLSTEKKQMAEALHNYYFGKALDVVRPGGLIVFVTSAGTMNSRTDSHRRYIAKRATLLGAIRLPQEAFKKTAGTEVVADILFLQRRAADDVPASIEDAMGKEPWLASVKREDLGSQWDEREQRQDHIRTNEYFARHPEMILGTESRNGSMYRGGSYTVEGFGGVLDLDKLQAALNRLPANIYKASTAAARTFAKAEQANTKQGTYVLEGGQLFVNDQGTLAPSTLTGKAKSVVLAFLPMRDAFQGVLDALTAHVGDAELAGKQKTLLSTYRKFVSAHGPVNAPANRKLIETDPNGPRVLGLEHTVKDNRTIKVKGLADIFTKRVIDPPKEPTTSASAADALSQSLSWKGHVDLEWMAQLLQQTPAQVAQALAGDIFQDPVTEAWAPKAMYLSGDVVTKLAQAEARATVDAPFAANVAALQAVQPTPKTPEDFTVPFGATYTPLETYQRFLKEVTRQDIDIRLANTATQVQFYVGEKYGTHEFMPQGAKLSDWIEDALNGRLPVMYSGDPRAKDQALTEAYHQSLQQLREQWGQWWVADPDAAAQLVSLYNALFNREVPPKYDEVPLILPNANPAIKFRTWQNRAVVRVMQAGNTLLNHAVGSGKTLEGVAVAMEWKRRGLANKVMIAVPNPVTLGWKREFLALYPTARLLVTDKEDFAKANRKRLLARIATNDWDAIIVAHTQFESIPVNAAYLRAFVQEQEDLLLASGAEQMGLSVAQFKDLVDQAEAEESAGIKGPATRQLNGRGVERSVKDVVRSVKKLRVRLRKRLAKDEAGESPVTFEEMGVDALIVDEAHYFKNLFFWTSKNNIKGLRGSDSDRAIDMFLKVRQINQASKSRNLVFLTGTPVTNAMSEVYTLFRYLAQEELDRLGMSGADSFFNNYAVATNQSEPLPGGGYKEVTRLRDWNNLKELSMLAAKYADTITTKDMVATGQLTIPKLKNGRATILATKPHRNADAFMEDLKQRLAEIKSGEPRVLRTKDNGDPVLDNYLVVGTDAKKWAIDPRLIDPAQPYDPHGRIPTAARKVAAIYKATAATKGTQLIFLDMGVPTKAALTPLPAQVLKDTVDMADVEPEDVRELTEEDRAEQQLEDELNRVDRDLYTEIKDQLVKQGVAADDIAFIHQARNPLETELLFKAMREGRIRVLLATRSKGGVGVNVQNKGVHVLHIDVPWRPDQVEQADGRFFRQGNENAEVEKTIMVTERSFDEYQWGLLATKNKSITQFWKGEIQSLEDIDVSQIDFEVSSALSTGDPRTLRVMELERIVRGLQSRATNFDSRQRSAKRELGSEESRLTTFERYRDEVGAALADAPAWAAAPHVDLLVVAGRRYHGSLTLLDKPTRFDLADKDGRAAWQQALEHLITDGSFHEEREVAQAGPYRITGSSFTLQLPTGRTVKVWDAWKNAHVEKAETEDVNAVRFAVKAGGLILGSTPEWTGRVADKAPDFNASLRAYMGTTRLAEAHTNYTRLVKETQTALAALTDVLAKVFPQSGELRERAAELKQLKIDLGQEKAPAPAEASADERDEDDDTPPKRPPSGRGGLQSTILPGAAELGEAIEAGLRKLAGDVRSDRNVILQALAPSKASMGAELGAGSIRAQRAASDQRLQRAGRTLKAIEHQMDRWSHAQSRQFWDAMENVTPIATLPGALRPIAILFREIIVRYQTVLLDRGILDGYLDHYFPHEWVKPSKAGATIRRWLGKRPLQGPESFRRKRTIPTMADGLAAGLEPVSWNPATQMLRKITEMERSIAGRAMFLDVKRQGLAKFVGAQKSYKSVVPEHWKRLPEFAMGTVYGPRQVTITDGAGDPHTGALDFGRLVAGHYYAPPEIVRLFENHLSPGLWGKSVTFDAWRRFGNLLNQAQLSFSFFHGMLTGLEAVVSKQAIVFEHLARGHGIEAIKKQLEVPVATAVDLVRGHAWMKEFYAADASGDALFTTVRDLVTAGGGGFGWSLFEHEGAPQQFMQRLREMAGAAERGDYGTATGKLALAALKAIPALIELQAKPIMEWWVPRLKLAAFMDLAAMEMARLGPTPDPHEARRVLGQAWDSIDNRFGQLRYDNLFWDNRFKHGLMASIRAVGWNVGSVREMGGAIPAQLGLIGSNVRELTGSNGGNGGRPQLPGQSPPAGAPQVWLHRKMAWLISLLFIQAVGAAIYMYLRTGHGPESAQDLMHPRNGEVDPATGREQRVNFPGYFKDLYAWVTRPGKTAAGKAHPNMTFAYQWLTNEDYFGTELRNPDDPLGAQLLDFGRYLETQFKPIAVSSFQRRAPGAASLVETTLGITPASAEIERTALENYLRDQLPPVHRTQAEAAKADARRALRVDMRAGQLPGGIQKARAAGLSAASIKATLRTERLGYLKASFQRATWAQAVHGYTIATPAERAQVQTILLGKVGRALTDAGSEANRARVRLQRMEALRLPTS